MAPLASVKFERYTTVKNSFPTKVSWKIQVLKRHLNNYKCKVSLQDISQCLHYSDLTWITSYSRGFSKHVKVSVIWSGQSGHLHSYLFMYLLFNIFIFLNFFDLFYFIYWLISLYTLINWFMYFTLFDWFILLDVFSMYRFISIYWHIYLIVLHLFKCIDWYSLLLITCIFVYFIYFTVLINWFILLCHIRINRFNFYS